MKSAAALDKIKLTAILGFFCFYLAFALPAACLTIDSSLEPKRPKPLKTKNVIVLDIDGPRYSETWAQVPGIIPNMSTYLRPQGTFYSNFLNDSLTYTNAGHAAITTGVWQPIDNFGAELPANPSLFQQYLKQTGKPGNYKNNMEGF